MSVSVFSIGFDVDGLPTSGLDFTNPVSIIAAIVMAFYLTATVIFVLLIAKGFLHIQRSKVYYFICVQILIIRVTSVCFPLANFFYGLMSCWGLCFVIIGQLDILKAFVVGSKYITREGITRVQIGFLIFHFLSIGGQYISIGYIGVPKASWITAYCEYGYILYCLVALSYETWHSIYVSRAVLKQLRIRNAMVHMKKENTETNAFNSIYYLIAGGLTLDWIGFFLFTCAWFAGSVYSLSLGAIGATMGIISLTQGMGHMIFLALIFKYLKEVNISHSNKKDSTSMMDTSKTTNASSKVVNIATK
ncbi:hypothetical protein HDV06_001581 [Boothiomyces sp. JEL0866]|nr:hypothetical protein HDV06_001581 [Boothiomyces sp. JEL0866]